jgi:metal-sulfur cluster biosynthetic enzyme
MTARRLTAQVLLTLLVCTVGALLIILPRLPRRSPEHIRDLPLNRENVYRVLSGIMDPELDVNIVDLGLVRSIKVSGQGDVRIDIIFTSPFCPLASTITGEIKREVSSLRDTGEVEVVVDRSTLWTPDMATAEAREKLEKLFP